VPVQKTGLEKSITVLYLTAPKSFEYNKYCVHGGARMPIINVLRAEFEAQLQELQGTPIRRKKWTTVSLFRNIERVSFW
jgi:hypothetical protein